jgi:hypothetical protein
MKPQISYSTLNTQEDTVSESGNSTDDSSDVENGKSGGSVAASPYWNAHAQFQNPTHAGFSPFVAFCFTLNYILGTGFLTIPWAFVQSGVVLSTILMILSAIASDIAKDFMLEAMARAEAMLDDQMHWIDRSKNHHGHHGHHRRTHSQIKRQQIAKPGRVFLPPTSKDEREKQRILLKQQQQGSPEQELTSYQRDTYDYTDDSSSDNNDNNKFHRSGSMPTTTATTTTAPISCCREGSRTTKVYDRIT